MMKSLVFLFLSIFNICASLPLPLDQPGFDDTFQRDLRLYKDETAEINSRVPFRNIYILHKLREAINRHEDQLNELGVLFDRLGQRRSSNYLVLVALYSWHQEFKNTVNYASNLLSSTVNATDLNDRTAQLTRMYDRTLSLIGASQSIHTPIYAPVPEYTYDDIDYQENQENQKNQESQASVTMSEIEPAQDQPATSPIYESPHEPQPQSESESEIEAIEPFIEEEEEDYVLV
jgi:hypothetical protein